MDADADVVPLPVEDRRAEAARAESVVPENMAGLDQDVVARFKASGPGWQTRMNRALREAAGL